MITAVRSSAVSYLASSCFSPWLARFHRPTRAASSAAPDSHSPNYSAFSDHPPHTGVSRFEETARCKNHPSWLKTKQKNKVFSSETEQLTDWLTGSFNISGAEFRMLSPWQHWWCVAVHHSRILFQKTKQNKPWTQMWHCWSVMIDQWFMLNTQTWTLLTLFHWTVGYGTVRYQSTSLYFPLMGGARNIAHHWLVKYKQTHHDVFEFHHGLTLTLRLHQFGKPVSKPDHLCPGINKQRVKRLPNHAEGNNLQSGILCN